MWGEVPTLKSTPAASQASQPKIGSHSPLVGSAWGPQQVSSEATSLAELTKRGIAQIARMSSSPCTPPPTSQPQAPPALAWLSHSCLNPTWSQSLMAPTSQLTRASSPCGGLSPWFLGRGIWLSLYPVGGPDRPVGVVTPQTQPWSVVGRAGLGLVHECGTEGTSSGPGLELAAVTQAPAHQESARGQNQGQWERL